MLVHALVCLRFLCTTIDQQLLLDARTLCRLVEYIRAKVGKVKVMYVAIGSFKPLAKHDANGWHFSEPIKESRYWKCMKGNEITQQYHYQCTRLFNYLR